MVAYASSLDYLLYRGYMYTGKRSLSDAAIYYSANTDSTTVGLNIFEGTFTRMSSISQLHPTQQ
jgi:hypothetical protein